LSTQRGKPLLWERGREFSHTPMLAAFFSALGL
jgi:hypothetical protein